MRDLEPYLYDLTKKAYHAYGEDAEWKNYRGEPMPRWSELPAATAAHWIAAIDAVLDVIESQKIPGDGR